MSRKIITLSNFENISNPESGSLLLSSNGSFTNLNEITIPEDTNNYNILNNTSKSINIGNKTSYQRNPTNICIGYRAGDGIGNSSNVIAIGNDTLKRTIEGDNNIAVGYMASCNANTACSNSISLGYNSGFALKRQYNISIGANSSYGAGGSNTIVLGTSAFRNTINGALYIKPIRQVARPGMPTNALFYDSGTGEWTYNT